LWVRRQCVLTNWRIQHSKAGRLVVQRRSKIPEDQPQRAVILSGER
jgi:hypothetical protein